jgi:hypothetical protein
MHRFMLLTALFALGCRPLPRTPFVRAVADDDAESVARFLGDGEPVDQRESRGLTPLMWAARTDSVRSMAVLIDAGADVNARDTSNRWTPLMHAVHTQSAGAVKLLLERGASPNAVEYDGQLVPLLMAAGNADAAIVRLLLQHGANARYKGEWGETPLAVAVSGGALTDLTDHPILGGCHPETVRAILEADPAIRLEDNTATRRAHFFAKFHGCVDAISLIGDDHSPKPRDARQAGSATASRSQP